MNGLSLAKFVVFVFSVVFLSACTLKIPNNTTDFSDIKSKRGYYIGTTGYSPANFPSPSLVEIQQYWTDVNNSGETYGVHLDWKDTGFVDNAARNTDRQIVLVLGFQDSAEWKNNSGELSEEIKRLLNKYPQIKYVAIGNEVNIIYEKDTAGFNEFISAYSSVYDDVKREFPNVQIFTTFQYEYLRGAAYLSGRSSKLGSKWEIIGKFGDKLDLIGITTYPHFDYKSPSGIPDRYFEELEKYSSKPIAITETGWISREGYGGRLSSITSEGYSGSEDEQAGYIARLEELLNPVDVEFVNWIFIHDITNWQEGDTPTQYELFDSIGLKKYQGTSKKAWDSWQELKSVD